MWALRAKKHSEIFTTALAAIFLGPGQLSNLTQGLGMLSKELGCPLGTSPLALGVQITVADTLVDSVTEV